MRTVEERSDSTSTHAPLARTFREGIKDYLDHLRLFSKNTRLYLAGSFLMGINFSVFLLLLNLYLKERGFMESEIGLVASSRAVGMTLMALPAAVILSRMRLKPILMVTVALFAIFSYSIVSADLLGYMIIYAVLSGMAFTFYRVAAGPFYMRNSTRKERTHIFSFSFGMMILAGTIGSLAAGKTAAWIGGELGDIVLGYRYTLYLGILVSLLSLMPFMLIKAAAPSDDEKRITLSRQQLRRRGKFYFKISFVNFLIGTGAGLIIPFLNLYFRDRFDLPPDTIGFYYFLVNFSMFAGILAGPVLARRFGLVRTIVFTQLMSIPFLLTLAYSYFLPVVVVAFVVRGALMNLGVPIVTNLGMELSDRSEQGLVNALLMVAWTSSWMVSTALGGRLIEQYGYTFTMNITIVLYVLSSVIFFMFFRRIESRSTDTGRWSIVEQ